MTAPVTRAAQATEIAYQLVRRWQDTPRDVPGASLGALTSYETLLADAIRDALLAFAARPAPEPAPGAETTERDTTWLAAMLTVSHLGLVVKRLHDGAFRDGMEMALEEIMVRLQMEAAGTPSFPRDEETAARAALRAGRE